MQTKTGNKIFYELLQREVDIFHQNNTLLILCDLNARVGNYIIPQIKQSFNETKYNTNGELLVYFLYITTISKSTTHSLIINHNIAEFQRAVISIGLCHYE